MVDYESSCVLQKLGWLIKKYSPTDVLKNDSDTLFYTGIEQKDIFDKLHEFVAKFVRRRWRGFAYRRSIYKACVL